MLVKLDITTTTSKIGYGRERRIMLLAILCMLTLPRCIDVVALLEYLSPLEWYICYCPYHPPSHTSPLSTCHLVVLSANRWLIAHIGKPRIDNYPIGEVVQVQGATSMEGNTWDSPRRRVQPPCQLTCIQTYMPSGWWNPV